MLRRRQLQPDRALPQCGSDAYDVCFTHPRVLAAVHHVLGEHASNEAVFEASTSLLIGGVLRGFNASVFAYGATGSGKTHTMTGTHKEPGLMVLTLRELFRRTQLQSA